MQLSQQPVAGKSTPVNGSIRTVDDAPRDFPFAEPELLLRPSIICASDPDFAEQVSKQTMASGVQAITCVEEEDLLAALAAVTPDVVLIHGRAEFVNRTVLRCNLIAADDINLVVGLAGRSQSIDLPEDFTQAIRVVGPSMDASQLGSLLCRSVQLRGALRAIKQHLASHRCVVDRLSEAQQVVLREVCEGKLNKWIAAEHGVSLRTIEQRRRRVFDVMGVTSAAPLGHVMGFAAALEWIRGLLDEPKTT